MIRERLEEIRGRIRAASERAKRSPEEIELVLVTKAVDPEEIKLAYGLGVRDFGENRVQEFLMKKEQLPADIRWHFIGHLQTNKVKKLLGQAALIQSLDRLELAREIQKEAQKQNQTVDVLLEVHISSEESKFGFEPDSVSAAVSEIRGFNRLKLRGLMGIGPHTRDEEAVRQSFRSLARLRDRLRDDFPETNWHYLSMGMSSDFELAVEEGANLLRIGSAVFGPRT